MKRKKRSKWKKLFLFHHLFFSLLHKPPSYLKNLYPSPTSWMQQTFPCSEPSYLRTITTPLITQTQPCSILRIWIMKPPKTSTPTTLILTIVPVSFRRTLQWFQTWMRTWCTLQRNTIVLLIAILQTPPSKTRTPSGTSCSSSLTWIASYFRVPNIFNFSDKTKTMQVKKKKKKKKKKNRGENIKKQ